MGGESRTRSSRATPVHPGTARSALRHPRVPDRLPRGLRLEHRHLDAERGPRRLRLRPHRLGRPSSGSSSPSSAPCSCFGRSAGCSPTRGPRKLLLIVSLQQTVARRRPGTWSPPTPVRRPRARAPSASGRPRSTRRPTAPWSRARREADLAGAVSLNSVQMNASGSSDRPSAAWCSSTSARSGSSSGTRVTFPFIVAFARPGAPAVRPGGRGGAPPAQATVGFCPRGAIRIVLRCLVTITDVLLLLHPLRRPDADPRRGEPRPSTRTSTPTASSTPASASARCRLDRQRHGARATSRRPSSCDGACSPTPRWSRCSALLRTHRARVRFARAPRRGHLLRDGDGAQHDDAEPARRPRAGPGDGAVDDGLRRHRRHGEPRVRPDRRRDRHDAR